MKIPSKIVPCPITEAIMEVRFDSKFDEGAVFGIIYSQIKDEFEKTINLPILEIPSSLRKTDPNLLYLPYYRLESKTNKNALIQIGPRVFSVIITKDYTGWDDFRALIEYGLQKLEKSEVASKITRFALRYVNFFDENILSKSNLAIKLNNEQLNGYNTTMRFELPDGDFLNVLSISNHAIKQEGTEIVKGSTIDIDTKIESELPNFFTNRAKLLDDCHNTEKKLFSSLLSDDYVKTLKEISYV